MTSKESRVYLLGKKKSDAVARTTERSTKTSGVRIQIIQNKVEISYFSCYLAAICYIAAILCSLRELVNCASSHWGGKNKQTTRKRGWNTKPLCDTCSTTANPAGGAALLQTPVSNRVSLLYRIWCVCLFPQLFQLSLPLLLFRHRERK